MNGKFSFLMLGATKATIARQPEIPGIVAGAIDQAARLIRDDPRRAAQIFLTHEPSGTLNGATAAAVIGDIKDEFGSAVLWRADHGRVFKPAWRTESAAQNLERHCCASAN